MAETFEQAVETVYHWVDEQVARAAPRCEISGRCCRFREYKHKLFLTRIEAERLFEAPLPPECQPEEVNRDQVDGVCPYQRQGRCTAREHRPLGCRIFFCDPDYDETACEITEEALRKLRVIHDQFGQPWEYRELSAFFEQKVFAFPTTL